MRRGATGVGARRAARAVPGACIVALAAAVASFAVVVPAATAQAAPGAQRTMGAGIRGDVVAQGSGVPVAGATVSVVGDRTSVDAAADGTFAFPSKLPTRAPYRRVTVDVAAPGWGRWRIEGAPLYPGDTLILHAVLRRVPFTDVVLTPAERAARGIAGGAVHPGEALTGNTCTGWDRQLVPTPTISVYRTETGVSERYDFSFYAAHVLPNEWISSWDADALGAGAIAVKTYAGYRAQPGHAYSSGGNCADVRDTVDGYFDPSWTTAAATVAVDATFGSVVYQNGALFVAHYYAGGKTDACARVEGQYAGWMSQWGTQNCALAGQLWPAIVDTFYSSDQTPTSWHYTGDLILDPTFASDGTYAFGAFKAALARTKGSGSDDRWLMHVTPRAGKQGAVFQQRPFLGGPTTKYHARVSLRCGASQSAPCPARIRVIVFPDGSNAGVWRDKVVNVPNDGLWHRYYMDPRSSGIDHASVRMTIYSTSPFDTDNWVLRTGYGGP
jgi:hypothetical protein